MERIVEPGKKISFFDQVTCVELLLFEDRLSASIGGEAAVTARSRIGWIEFQKSGKLLMGESFY